jgi:hypothetical protein
MNDLRNWRDINLRLVNRGRPSTYLNPALKNQDADLPEMNKGKVGKPYSFSNMLIIAAFAVKSIFKIGYREAAGNIKDFLDLVGVKSHPDFRTIQWRIRQLDKEGIKLMIYKSIDEEEETIDVIVDSTGVKSRKDGEYRSNKYGKVKKWKQLHIVISRKTRKILNVKVTRANSGDANRFVPLMKPIVERKRVNSSRTDGGYDSEENFEFCDRNNIDPIIPVHINAQSGRHRRKRIEEQLGVVKKPGKYRQPTKEQKKKNQEEWKERVDYHDRSLIETVNAVFKGVFDESVFSKTTKMIEKELLLKAVMYNRYIA